MTKTTPLLMFEGKAEEAMNFYISLFGDSKIGKITRYKANEAGPEGSIMHAIFALNGREYMCIDSPAHHEFTFTPAFSIFVDCESEGEVDRLFEKLSKGGKVLMPLGAYGFSEKFGWIDDQYGVSWQINLKKGD
ncbi:MAG: 3-demethylubiquinone-9 3-methyltransferase [uncultured bacterium]|nr:MAG: 3-demethylubiquinone-9 3-methyltransferase [uncultured bacterium]KKT73454.1 MAG: 3-demethylubiquinone-9 3-methyltransferase [Candidatus Peregrinibacteria bacterium GW2011_GWA2_44_7]